MKKIALSEMTLDQLVDRFVELGVAQDQAEINDKIGRYNILFMKMVEVDGELRRRGDSARLSLLPLYNHSNMQVRYMAAVYTLAVAPVAARAVIENIATLNYFPYTMNARGILNGLNDGSFVPT